ncbi:MAG: family 20 glycosylhydrolase [Prevotella sp.]|nr:family 20 glycosylhydrolase [Prevotella sp.]
MKRFSFLSLLLIVVISSLAQQKPFTVPEIHSWHAGEGTFVLTKKNQILISDSRLLHAAQMLNDGIAHCKEVGLDQFKELSIQQAKKGYAGSIFFKYKKQSKKLGPEAYTIHITDRIVIEAEERGAIHAASTLTQMVKQQKGYASWPKGVINDKPDYPLRGLMLDCGRKYIPMSYLRQLLPIMSYYKMNTLQIHLNDNGFPVYFQGDWDKTYSAFRMESDLFPGLTARDGHYTKNEFRQFVKDAADMGIEVIPEIDAPAHCLAFTHYRPAFGNKEFGVDHLDLTNPAVTLFLDSLYDEYLGGPDPVFAGPRVHIGTDEYSNKRQEVTELFRAFTNHFIEKVESYGKQAMIWGSLTHSRGTTPVKVDNVLMQLWSKDYSRADSMKALGYQLVSIPDGQVYIVPAAGYYYDYLNIPYLYKEFSPVRLQGLTFAEDDPQFSGGMFAVWNDVCGNGISVMDIHHRLLPAMQAISTKCWNSHPSLSYDEWADALNSFPTEPVGAEILDPWPHRKGIVYTEDQVLPNSERANGIQQVSYDYRVSFDIEYQPEERGTALFRSPNAEFYLSDPVSGKLGFVRDGYLFTFNWCVRPGMKEHIAIEGTNRETRLYVDGRLIQTLDYDHRLNNNGKPYNIVRTLVFPLATTDASLRSEVSNLKVEKL